MANEFVVRKGIISLGGVTFPYVSGNTTYNVTADDFTVDCVSGTFTVNLPTAVGITGKIYSIKNSGTGVITVDGSGGETIDDKTTQVLSQYNSIVVVSDGSNWIILGSNSTSPNSIKSGTIANTSFTGTPRKYTVTFTTNFTDDNYAVNITGGDARSWTIESRTSSSFIINSNSNTALDYNTYWEAIKNGEY